jgi:hypothetical protein
MQDFIQKNWEIKKAKGAEILGFSGMYKNMHMIKELIRERT